MFLPKRIVSFIDSITEKSLPAHSALSEEEQYTPPTFAEGDQEEPIESSSDGSYLIKIDDPTQKICFGAFLDGVQRTIAWKYIPTSCGALVPIHLAHIGVLAILRRESGELFIEPELRASRILILGPFEGLRRAGVHIEELDEVGRDVLLDTDNRTFAFPPHLDEWVICDTTYCGTDPNRGNQTEGALLGDAMFNEGLIRSRAQGRVATLRQRLEFAVLARLRRLHPSMWVIVDGPLFFIEKWRQRAANVLIRELGEANQELVEDKLLINAVGIIKGQRLKPKHPDQIIKMDLAQRSLVVPLSYEVDIDGRRDTHDEQGRYGGMHFTWYTRLRGRSIPPYGLLGLIRLDIHRVSLPGLVRADALTKQDFKQYSPLIDSITWSIWHERWPGFRRKDDFRTASTLYPIWQVEKICKSMLFPRRYLAYFNL